MSLTSQLFISYARKDGTEMALRLQSNLETEGFDPWLDASRIHGGASWTLEIEHAIDRCDVELALLTAGSYLSDICRAEQLRALRSNKRVIPLLLQATADRPLHLEHLHYIDFSTEARYAQALQELIDCLHSDERRALPDKFRETAVTLPPGIPPLPINYVQRSDELAQLRQAVVGDETSRQVAITALRGMGGIGKTVLAKALCKDEIVKAAFPDGVVWVEIGPNPGDLVTQMREVGVALNDLPHHYSTPEDSTNRLRTILRDKAVLIVLDNVWHARHVHPFWVDAPRCQVLFTTRNREVALSLEAQEVRLGTFSAEQAIGYLAKATGREDPKAAEIAKRVGFHPLALKLAAARLREPMSGADWLDRFQHVSQLKLGRYSDSPEESLEVCFDLSVNQLASDRYDDRRFYYALGVFPKGSAIPTPTAVRLWQRLDPQLTAFDCQELQIEIARLELLDVTSDDAFLRLHDLLHDYARGKLGSLLSATHAELLRGYNPTGRPWNEVDDDGYLYDHLVYHLGASDADDELQRLFFDERWLKARIAQRSYQYDGYLEDLELSLRRLHEQAAAQLAVDEEPANFTELFHRLLVRTSFNSVAANYVLELVVRAVELEHWSATRAVSVAMRVPETAKRVAMLTAIIATGRLEAEEQARAQELAWQLTLDQDPNQQGKLLADLAPVLPGDLKTQALSRALELLPELSFSRDDVLIALAPMLSGDLLARAVDIALRSTREFWSHDSVIAVWKALAPHLSEPELEGALRAVLTTDKGSVRDWVLPELAPQFPERLLELSVEAAVAEESEWTSKTILKAVAPYLRGELAQRAMDTTLAHKEDMYRANILSSLAPHLPDTLRIRALEAALNAVMKTTNQSLVWADVWSNLGPQLSGTLLAQTLESVQAMPDPEHRVIALSSLAPQLPSEAAQVRTAQKALKAVADIIGDWTRALTFRKVVPLLNGPLVEQALDFALSLDDRSLPEALTALAPQLTGTLAISGFEKAKQIGTAKDRARALVALAPNLPTDEQEQALRATMDAAAEITEEWQLGPLLLAAAACPSSFTVAEPGLKLALRIKASESQRNVLSAFAARLPAARCYELALSLDQEHRNAIMAALAPMLKADTLEHALVSSLRFADEDNLWQALLGLLPYTSGQCRRRLLKLGLDTTASVGSEASANLLVGIAPHLTGDLVERCLETVLRIPDELHRMRALDAMMPQLNEDQLVGTVDEISSLSDKEAMAFGLCSVLPYFADELELQVAETALACTDLIQDPVARVRALVRLLDRQPQAKLKELAVAEGLTTALKIEHAATRVRTLASLVPYVEDDELRTKVLHIGLGLVAKMDLEAVSTHHHDLEVLSGAMAFEHVLAVAANSPGPRVVQDRVAAVADLLPHLPDELKLPALNLGFEALKYERSLLVRSLLLLRLIPHLPPEQYEGLLESTLQMTDEGEMFGLNPRELIMTALIAFLPDSLLAKGLDSVPSIASDAQRSKCLANLAPRLDSTLLQQALDLSLGLEDHHARAQAVTAFLTPMPDDTRVLTVGRSAIVEYALTLQDKNLASLLAICREATMLKPPVLESEKLGQIAEDIIKITQDWQWI